MGRLRDIEQANEVHVLYAVETGSRAWDFASVNSDFDVRFIYSHPRDWYLTLEEGRGVLETPIVGDMDIQGWDIRKALRLFAKSNPPLNEWLVSPLVYLEQGPFAPRMRELSQQYYSPKGVAHHYLHMAKCEFQADSYKGGEVILKKYLYVVRPLLNILWLSEHQTIPPISLTEILSKVSVDPDARIAIDQIITQKRSGLELGKGARIPVLDRYLESLFVQAEVFCAQANARKTRTDALNQLFRDVLIANS